MFPYEKLDVYWVTVEFEKIADQFVVQMQARAPKLAAQLETSTDSILLNLCEGASYFAPSEKAKYYRYARGSAGEASGNIRRAVRRKLVNQTLAEEAEACSSV